MSYAPYVINEFGGLDTSDPLTATGAIDCYNVLPARGGGVAVRPGMTYSTTLPANDSYTAAGNLTNIFSGYAGATPRRVWGVSGANPETVITDGAGSYDADTKQAISVASFGTPSAAYLLLTAADNSTMRQYNGSAFAAITYSGTNPTAKYVAIQTGENRVVVAGPSLSGGNRVLFSDAGDHTTYGANNYVGLTPGDGESISAIVAWGNLVLVFKQTKIFVFYGNSTDSSGNPVFNYRVIDGIGAVSGTFQSAVAGSDGVYFWFESLPGHGAPSGLYRTDGATVTCVSRPVSNLIFDNITRPETAAPTATYNYMSIKTDAAISAVGDQVWVPMVDNNSQNVTLVYHIPSQDFYPLTWDSATTDRMYAAAGYSNTVYAVNGTTTVRKYNINSASDQKNSGVGATTFSSMYRTGYRDFGFPGREKTIRETLLTGNGSPNVRVSSDFRALDTATAVTMGSDSSLTPGQGRRRVANRGMVFSTAISATSGWAISQIAHNVHSTRPAGTEATV